MTEADWLGCAKPGLMLHYLDGQLSRRKLALIACASCRHLWRWCVDNRSRVAVGVAQQFVDGGAQANEITTAQSDAKAAAVTAKNALEELKTARERSGELDEWPSIQEHWAFALA